MDQCLPESAYKGLAEEGVRGGDPDAGEGFKIFHKTNIKIIVLNVNLSIINEIFDIFTKNNRKIFNISRKFGQTIGKLIIEHLCWARRGSPAKLAKFSKVEAKKSMETSNFR